MTTKQQALLEKEFKIDANLSVSRGDYESLPSPMCAWTWHDRRMKELARRIAMQMVCFKSTDQDRIMAEFWRVMENVAVEMGMEYYEDMPQKRADELEQKWNEIQ